MQELKEAIKLIEDFCRAEYGSSKESSDLSNYPLAYTTDEDSSGMAHEVQVSVDLVHFKMILKIDDVPVRVASYASLAELIERELHCLEFDSLVCVTDQMWRTFEKTA
jgi:hypothetical protein